MPVAARKRKAFIATETQDEVRPPSVQMRDIFDQCGALIRPARLGQAEWIDPDDTNPNRRDAKRVQGFRVVSVLVNLHHRSPREITADHVKAAERLTNDYEIGDGARTSGGGLERVDGAATAGVGPSGAQLDALRDFRKARDAMGPLGQYVLPVVLSGWTVQRLAQSCALSIDRVHGRLASGLDILHSHYWPDKDVATIVPSYIIDPYVTDIPQNRLGRAKRA